jgi:hypothetical protein
MSVKKANPFSILFWANLSFLILTFVAMIVYRGGSYHIHEAVGYNFFRNFFSDLGRVHTFVNTSNLRSQVLFCFAILLLSGGLSFFIRPFLLRLRESKSFPIAYYTALISAYFFSIFLLGVAATPYDLFFPQHLLAVRIAFILLVPLCLSISFLVYHHEELPNRYFMLLLFDVVMLCVYIFILFKGPRISDSPTFQPVSQKIIVYMLSLGMLYLSAGAQKYLK